MCGLQNKVCNGAKYYVLRIQSPNKHLLNLQRTNCLLVFHVCGSCMSPYQVQNPCVAANRILWVDCIVFLHVLHLPIYTPPVCCGYMHKYMQNKRKCNYKHSGFGTTLEDYAFLPQILSADSSTTSSTNTSSLPCQLFQKVTHLLPGSLHPVISTRACIMPCIIS